MWKTYTSSDNDFFHIFFSKKTLHFLSIWLFNFFVPGNPVILASFLITAPLKQTLLLWQQIKFYWKYINTA